MFKFESDDYRIGALLIICVLMIVLGIVCGNGYSTKKFVEGNYCNTPGVTANNWVKCDMLKD